LQVYGSESSEYNVLHSALYEFHHTTFSNSYEGDICLFCQRFS